MSTPAPSTPEPVAPDGLEEEEDRNDIAVFGFALALMGVLTLPLFPVGTLVALLGGGLSMAGRRRVIADPSVGAATAARAGIGLAALAVVGTVLLIAFGFAW